MRQKTKQPAVPVKKVYMKNSAFGYESNAEANFRKLFCFCFCARQLRTYSINQKPEKTDDIQFTKASLSKEFKKRTM